jgi:hypothetical protein
MSPWLAVIGKLLRARSGRVGRGAEVAKRQLPARMDRQRLVLLAQRERHPMTPAAERGSPGRAEGATFVMQSDGGKKDCLVRIRSGQPIQLFELGRTREGA